MTREVLDRLEKAALRVEEERKLWIPGDSSAPTMKALRLFQMEALPETILSLLASYRALQSENRIAMEFRKEVARAMESIERDQPFCALAILEYATKEGSGNER